MSNLTTRPAVFLQLMWKLLQYECLFASFELSVTHVVKVACVQMNDASTAQLFTKAGEQPNKNTQEEPETERP